MTRSGAIVAGACSLAMLVLQNCSSTSSPTAGPTGVQALQPTSAAGAGDGALRIVSSLPAPSQTGDGDDQPLSPGDVLELDFFQVDNLDRTVQIDANGRVSLALIGTVTAAGKSVRQFEHEVKSAYGAKYLQNPDVTVFVKDSAGQRVTIDGEVAKAGIVPVSSTATLLDVVALAGGFRPVADETKVFVYRDSNGQKLVANYNVKAIRQGGAPNPRIYGGDVIVVFPSSSKVAVQNLKEALGVASSAARLAVF
ncbi:polysaccharide biosynthesis/export family protein [Oryzicola mucosus]|uniref:Polysaccharide export protein n=1 Tax=Oryzicola mucosus TaxID=2767425 RepID=A0A8J6PYE6_9HYPH|nr:polysaccharide biosynthesis/export family protein [Oryzicola mucosus]MBD0413465.1 polysaccharide export protein [Oryzicola mucosus]